MKVWLASLGLAVGGTTAAVVSPPLATHVAAPAQAKVAVTGPGRIAISDAEMRRAYADGSFDRPVKTLLDVPKRMSYGEFRWDERGVPRGPVWIRVDLGAQLISVFRAGHEIGTAVILYGADEVRTPTGRFPILAKLKDHRSSTYDAPMPYTLRLTGDGVSIHGSNVRWGFATHGCVGVPTAFAAKLFDAVSKGDEVVIVAGSKARRRPTA